MAEESKGESKGELEWETEDTGLSRPLRAFPPGRWMAEVTTRTIHGRCLLKPTKDANERIEGVIGRALDKYPGIQLIAYWFLSNHYHMLVSAPDAPTLSAFMNHVNSNLARELGALYGWREQFWSRRYRAILVVGEIAEKRRLKYLLSQGSKDGLVLRPNEWPGASSLRAMTEGINAIGVWFNRSKECNARAAGKKVKRNEFATRYEILLAKLPCWRALSTEEHRAKCKEIVAEIERETAEMYARERRRPLGVKRILEQDPHEPPKSELERSPAPMCHAATFVEFEFFRKFYYRFRDRYRAASKRFREGIPEALSEFPTRCFLPSRPPIPRLKLSTARA